METPYSVEDKITILPDNVCAIVPMEEYKVGTYLPISHVVAPYYDHNYFVLAYGVSHVLSNPDSYMWVMRGCHVFVSQPHVLAPATLRDSLRSTD